MIFDRLDCDSAKYQFNPLRTSPQGRVQEESTTRRCFLKLVSSIHRGYSGFQRVDLALPKVAAFDKAVALPSRPSHFGALPLSHHS